MRSVRLLRNDNVVRIFSPLWNSYQSKNFGGSALVTKKQEILDRDPYEGNFNFTECDQYTKVTVIGAAGRVGRTLSLLLKTCPLVDHLCLFDTDKSVKGIGVDISHIDTKCCVSYVCGMRNIQEALDAPDVVVIAAGCPTSPQLIGKKLFDKNAPIVAGLSEACARFCPKACIVLITSPINSLLPVMGEVYQLITNRIPSRKLFGLTTLDVVRANTFVAEVIRKDPNNVIVPVIGGTSQETIVPVISQMKPCCKIKRGEMLALTECLKRAEGNLVDCQNCGTRGASSLSTAYAAFRFTSSLVMALKGAEDIIECAFVKSDIIPELEYLASPLKLGIRGVEHNFGYPHLSDRDKELSCNSAISPDEEKVDNPRSNFKTDVPYQPHAYWITNPQKPGLESMRVFSKRKTTSTRGFHTINQGQTQYEDGNLRKKKPEKFKRYLLEDRKKAGVSKKIFGIPRKTDLTLKYKGEQHNETSKQSPWDLKFERTHYKLLNASAKQKFRSFKMQKKFTPSASVLLLLDKKKKERIGKNTELALGHEKNKAPSEEEDTEAKNVEEKELACDETKKLVVTDTKEKDETSKYKEYIIKQLQELKKENEELKKKLISVVENKNLETALQVQTDNLELEKTKLKACWLIMSSTMDAFSNFCRKFTSKTDPKLLEAARAMEDDQESDDDCKEDDTSSPPTSKRKGKYDEKYYNFLEKLMEDQVECERTQSRVGK